jgi:hypothetical protein
VVRCRRQWNSGRRPAARSLEDIGGDLDALERMIANFEAQAAARDKEKDADKKREMQRYLDSLYPRLLGMAERVRQHLDVQKQLLDLAVAGNPKQDPNGGVTKTLTADQIKWKSRINALEGRLKALQARIDGLRPQPAKPVKDKDGKSETPDGGRKPG